MNEIIWMQLVQVSQQESKILWLVIFHILNYCNVYLDAISFSYVMAFIMDSEWVQSSDRILW